MVSTMTDIGKGTESCIHYYRVEPALSTYSRDVDTTCSADMRSGDISSHPWSEATNRCGAGVCLSTSSCPF